MPLGAFLCLVLGLYLGNANGGPTWAHRKTENN
jgi:hypothetical protein